MKIFPAIDILGGRVVRLTGGDYSEKKVYADDPEAVASNFMSAGADCLHVVDLDGARSGRTDNADVVRKLSATGMFVEIGGGIRTEDRIKAYLDCGADKVILGTAAVKKPDFLDEMLLKYGERIAVGVDARNGKVAVNGWEEVTSVDAVDFCKSLQLRGAGHIIYTDISKDGQLQGTNMSIYKVLCQTLSLKITASGGITYLDEIEELKKMNVYAAILGKAVYECRLDLRAAIAVAEE